MVCDRLEFFLTSPFENKPYKGMKAADWIQEFMKKIVKTGKSSPHLTHIHWTWLRFLH